MFLSKWRACKSAIAAFDAPYRAIIYFILIFVYELLVLQSGAFAAASSPLMTVPGRFNVSATGAATYTVPIAVSPGSASVIPGISLSYSSQSGDSFVGIGWALNGLPMITRCPRTIAQDATHGGVNYDSGDRFCLDGQRLMLINGTYGSDGSEYRTEIESFSRIIAHGGTGYGPAWFEIHTKAGQVLELGNTIDSQVLVVSATSGTPTTTARAWAVNKIYDIVGNYLTVTYNCAAASGACTDIDRITNGEVYPLRLDYTGNAAAGVSPYNSVRFSYVARSDAVPYYQAGGIIRPTVVLTDIKTYQGGSTVVYDYHLAYRAGTAVLRSHLTSITLCDGSGTCPIPCNGSVHCLSTTTFGWQGGASGLAVTGTANSIGAGKSLLPGDFNGDGLVDVEVAAPVSCSAFPVYLAPNFTTPSSTTVPNPGAADTNCNNTPGQTMLAPNGTAENLLTTNSQDSGGNPLGYVSLYQSFPNSDPASLGASVGADAPPSIAGDFDGDGIPDVTFLEYPDSPVWFGDPSGMFHNYESLPNVWAASVNSSGVDFDGDGCTDFLAVGWPFGLPTNAYYSCNPAVAFSSAPNGSGFALTYADFNGDGKTDILLTSTTASGQLWLASGTGFINVTSSLPSGWGVYTVKAGDWNGDGKADIILISRQSGVSHKVYLSTGTDFTPALDGSGNPIAIANSSTTTNAVVADWNNDGAADFWLQLGATDVLYTFSYTPELITSISDDIGANTAITYDRINQNGSFYTHTPFGGTYPTQEIDGPQYVVREIDGNNGLGTCTPPSITNCYRTTYAYAHAQTNLTGRGFLGFSQVVSSDLQTNIVQTTNYGTIFPFIGLVTSETKTDGSVTLSSTSTTLASNSGCGATPAGTGVNVVCITQTVQVGNDLNGASFPTTTTNYTYDNYGNALTICVTVSPTCVSGSDGSRKTTNTYSNDTANWFLGRLLTTSVNSTVGSSNMIRNSSFSYDPVTGFLTQEVIEPGVATCNSGSSSCTVTTDYVYDAFGHRIKATVSGTGIASRFSKTDYDPAGQFQIGATNALGQPESWTYDARFGLPVTHADLNGLTTSWTFDIFGRVTKETRPDGTQTHFSYAYCSGACPTYGRFYTTSEAFAADGTTQIGPLEATYYDMLSRVVANDTQGFNGANIRIATVYDPKERIQETSRPYFTVGGSAASASFIYDDLDRITQANFPDGSNTRYAFNGLTTTVTNNPGQVTTTIKNAQGLNYQVVDAASHATTYTYNAFGDLLTVTDPSTNVVTNTFDIRGNKITSVDPDMGHWSYIYDVLGELTNQTDANGNSTTLTYDLLGRAVIRAEAGLYSSWTYGTSQSDHNVGQVVDAMSCSTSACSTLIADQSLIFDAFGRPSSSILQTSADHFAFNNTYSATNGKVETIARPSGFSQKILYNTYGYSCSLTDTAGTPTCSASGGAQLFLRVNSRDAELHLTQSTAGNGVITNQTFDANTGRITCVYTGTNCTSTGTVASLGYHFDTIGNLTDRTDSNQGYTERFCYDNLNRLINYNIGTVCTGGKIVGYDAIGNITSKSDVGAYHYPSPGAVRPHAVSSITGTVDGLTNPLYNYDANGNLLCTSSGGGCTGTVGRQVVSTAFNMAATVTQGSISLGLTYDDRHQRIQQTSTVSGVATTTIYLDDPASGVMSERTTVGLASPYWIDYLTMDGQIVAQRSVTYGYPLWGSSITWGAGSTHPFNWTVTTPATTTLSYFTLDHLGSIAVIADESGAVIQRLSFDAWGKPRNPNGTDVSCGTVTSPTTRGFTNQEQMPTQCLVNLNARLYNASIGKFLAPDSIVPDTFDGQSFDRYAYVSNNPLNFADPYGHEDCPTGQECADVNGTRYPGGSAIFGTSPSFAFSGGADAPVTAATLNPNDARIAISAALAGNSLPPAYGGNPGNITPPSNTVSSIENVEVSATRVSTGSATSSYSFTGGSQFTNAAQVIEQVTVTAQKFYGPGVKSVPFSWSRFNSPEARPLTLEDTETPDGTNANACPLVRPSGNFETSSGTIPLFQPQFSDRLGQAIEQLNSQGITPTMTDGYRTDAMQAARRSASSSGASPYGAAQGVSAHQVALASDFGKANNNGNNAAILQSMTDAGLLNGAKFDPHDPVHYYQPGARRSQTRALADNCQATYNNSRK